MMLRKGRRSGDGSHAWKKDSRSWEMVAVVFDLFVSRSSATEAEAEPPPPATRHHGGMRRSRLGWRNFRRLDTGFEWRFIKRRDGDGDG